jgi:hypothetical protein
MGDVSDLKAVGEILKPLFKDLAGLAEADGRASDQSVTDAQAAVARLGKLLDKPANGPKDVAKQRGVRAEAMQAVRSALVELRIQAITRSVSLTPSQELLRSVIVDSLKDKIGRIATVAAFDPLTKLLSSAEIDLMKFQLEGAAREIAQREQAKLILDTAVDVAIAAGKIAMMLI